MNYDPYKHHRRSIRLQGAMERVSATERVRAMKMVRAKNFSPPHDGTQTNDGTLINDDNGHTNNGAHHQPCGTSNTIGSVVRGFKIGVTKWMRQNTTDYNVWQRNYWEHIIRNEAELDRIRIRNNPKTWQGDKLNMQ